MTSSIVLRLLIGGLVAVSMTRQQAHACDNAVLGTADPVVLEMMASNQIQVADPSHNVGVYAWNDSLQRHVLVASHLDVELLFSPPEPSAGDVVVEDFASAGDLSCGTPELPPVIVTAPTRNFVGRPFIRIRSLFFGWVGGGGRITYTAGTPVPDNPANPEYATCTADEQSRFHHANRDVGPYAAARFLARRPLRPGQFVRVTYNDGGTEVWQAVGGAPAGTVAVFEPPMAGTLRCP